jgi:short subunit dehydrogenase-like uncharacterized protein
MSEFDVVVFGASGFTGKLITEYLHKTYGESDLKWAIAGRNESKLKALRKSIRNDESDESDAIPILLVDSSDTDSLNTLVARTKVVCTTVGPYAKYGNDLVKACAESGTHYCDLTGEVQWMRRMIDQHMTSAESSGARIVHSCGFDSIPSDLGVHFLQREMQRKFGKFATNVTCRIGSSSGGVSGGTFDSMITMIEEIRVDPSLADLLADPYSLNPRNTPPGNDAKDQAGVRYDDRFQQWTAPFVMASINTRVVRRSHALLGFPYGNSFRYDESMLTGDGLGGRLRAAMVSGGTGLMVMAAAAGPTRSLLKKIAPSPGEGPSEETILNGFFNIELLGWNEQDELKVAVTGNQDPGYGATSKMIAECALCLACDDLDSSPGVTTPAVSMGDALLSRLEKNAGMTFSVS